MKRHGVAVIHIKQLGALAGVDATVPDFEFAGPLCNRKFLAVSHAPALALGIDHAGGVVPFAHAVLAYAYVYRMNRALQTRQGFDRFHFSHCRRGRAGW